MRPSAKYDWRKFLGAIQHSSLNDYMDNDEVERLVIARSDYLVTTALLQSKTVAQLYDIEEEKMGLE